MRTSVESSMCYQAMLSFVSIWMVDWRAAQTPSSRVHSSCRTVVEGRAIKQPKPFPAMRELTSIIEIGRGLNLKPCGGVSGALVKWNPVPAH